MSCQVSTGIFLLICVLISMIQAINMRVFGKLNLLETVRVMFGQKAVLEILSEFSVRTFLL